MTSVSPRWTETPKLNDTDTHEPPPHTTHTRARARAHARTDSLARMHERTHTHTHTHTHKTTCHWRLEIAAEVGREITRYNARNNLGYLEKGCLPSFVTLVAELSLVRYWRVGLPPMFGHDYFTANVFNKLWYTALLLFSPFLFISFFFFFLLL